ncbi:hypothetical protein B296_00004670 [Ensete ventricosum]|uniref:Uncharacterized protein n=1 Tax=Ensete ventricosum TaxID=4639 RepID=A0A426Z0V6_ENSVE|nr:hypothetical protein B296_00004670 [Ensete ventricosum]
MCSILDEARNDRARLEGDVLSLTKAVALLKVELKAEGPKAVAAYKASRGFESGLEKMGRVIYEFRYQVAFEWFREKHLEIGSSRTRSLSSSTMPTDLRIAPCSRSLLDFCACISFFRQGAVTTRGRAAYYDVYLPLHRAFRVERRLARLSYKSIEVAVMYEPRDVEDNCLKHSRYSLDLVSKPLKSIGSYRRDPKIKWGRPRVADGRGSRHPRFRPRLFPCRLPPLRVAEPPSLATEPMWRRESSDVDYPSLVSRCSDHGFLVSHRGR